MATRNKPRHEPKKPKKTKVPPGAHAPVAPRPPLGGLPHS